MNSTRLAFRQISVLLALIVAATLSLLLFGPAPTASAASAATTRAAASPWLPKSCRTAGKVICINKTARKLYYVRNNRVQLTLDARFGGRSTPTREGVFKVTRKVQNEWSTLYRSSMPYSMYFSGGQAIHYSSDFARYGYSRSSHGCVNIRNWNGIKWLYSQIPVGTKVVVFR